MVKAIVYPAKNVIDDVHIKGYTVEYYYDSKQKPVFAFAYKKTSKGVKEFRAYYGKDGKLYRYIDSNGKTVDYKKGKEISGTNGLQNKLYGISILYVEHALV